MTRTARIASLTLIAGLAGVAGLSAAPEEARSAPAEVELDEAEVFIEWNSTDTDFGIQFFWDGEPWTRMTVKNERGRPVLSVKTKKGVKAQGLTEGFFESAEPPAAELGMEEFLDRFPEGEYEFIGRSAEGGRLVGDAAFTHDLPAPPVNLSPGTGAVVSSGGFQARFDAVMTNHEGGPIDIVLYHVIVEKEDDEPILQVFSVILPPDRTSVFVPGEFLEPDTEYKLEIIVQEESGNRTIAETGLFTTDSGE